MAVVSAPWNAVALEAGKNGVSQDDKSAASSKLLSRDELLRWINEMITPSSDPVISVPEAVLRQLALVDSPELKDLPWNKRPSADGVLLLLGQCAVEPESLKAVQPYFEQIDAKIDGRRSDPYIEAIRASEASDRIAFRIVRIARVAMSAYAEMAKRMGKETDAALVFGKIMGEYRRLAVTHGERDEVNLSMYSYAMDALGELGGAAAIDILRDETRHLAQYLPSEFDQAAFSRSYRDGYNDGPIRPFVSILETLHQMGAPNADTAVLDALFEWEDLAGKIQHGDEMLRVINIWGFRTRIARRNEAAEFAKLEANANASFAKPTVNSPPLSVVQKGAASSILVKVAIGVICCGLGVFIGLTYLCKGRRVKEEKGRGQR